MSFFRAVSFRDAWADFKSIWTGEQKHRPRFLLLALAATATIFLTFVWNESGFEGDPPKPEIIYFENWTLDRTDEEIVASNFENYKARLLEEKAEMERRERIRENYRALGRATGIDVGDDE